MKRAGLTLCVVMVLAVVSSAIGARAQTSLAGKVHTIVIPPLSLAAPPGTGDFRQPVTVPPNGCEPTGNVNFSMNPNSDTSTMQAEFYCNAWEGSPPYVWMKATLDDNSRAQDIGPGTTYVETVPSDGPNLDAVSLAAPYAYASFPTGLVENITVQAYTTDGSAWTVSPSSNPNGICTWGTYAPGQPNPFSLVCHVSQPVTVQPGTTWGTYPIPG